MEVLRVRRQFAPIAGRQDLSPLAEEVFFSRQYCLASRRPRFGNLLQQPVLNSQQDLALQVCFFLISNISSVRLTPA